MPAQSRSLVTGALLSLIAGAGAFGCATRQAAPPAPPPAPSAEAAAGLTPPPVPGDQPSASGERDDSRAGDREIRRAIFEAAWTLVRDKHYDKTLGGLDWTALRAKYEPLAIGAPDTGSFYRLLNQMMGELGQSHLEVTGPGAPASPALDREGPGDAGAERGGAGDPGLTVRMVEGRPTVTAVDPGSPAERAGLRPGFIVTEIGGWPVRLPVRSARPLRPVEERFYLRVAAARRLLGPPATRVTVKFLDASDRPGQAVLERVAPKTKPVKLGLLPPLYPDVRVSQSGEVGVLAFNLFLTEGVLPRVQSAIDGFRARGAKALIIDLRGNPGGQGAVAIPVAARLVDKPLSLGTLQYRDFNQSFTANPLMGVKPFLGRVVIVTDEGTASTSEMFAAGLQEAGRAVVVGDATLGAVLPSQVESLPGGAIMQYVVADFRTPKGVLLEGRGVQPDRRVMETRAALLGGRDPVLDAALAAARASRSR